MKTSMLYDVTDIFQLLDVMEKKYVSDIPYLIWNCTGSSAPYLTYNIHNAGMLFRIDFL